MSRNRTSLINIEDITRLDCQFIIHHVKQINTRSREDIREMMAQDVRDILYEVANGEGDPFAKRRSRAQEVTEL